MYLSRNWFWIGNDDINNPTQHYPPLPATPSLTSVWKFIRKPGGSNTPLCEGLALQVVFVGLGWGGRLGVKGGYRGIVYSCLFPHLKSFWPENLLGNGVWTSYLAVGIRAQNYVGVCFDAQASKMTQHELCQNKDGSDKGVLSMFLGVPIWFSHITVDFSGLLGCP